MVAIVRRAGEESRAVTPDLGLVRGPTAAAQIDELAQRHALFTPDQRRILGSYLQKLEGLPEQFSAREIVDLKALLEHSGQVDQNTRRELVRMIVVERIAPALERELGAIGRRELSERLHTLVRDVLDSGAPSSQTLILGALRELEHVTSESRLLQYRSESRSHNESTNAVFSQFEKLLRKETALFLSLLLSQATELGSEEVETLRRAAVSWGARGQDVDRTQLTLRVSKLSSNEQVHARSVYTQFSPGPELSMAAGIYIRSFRETLQLLGFPAPEPGALRYAAPSSAALTAVSARDWNSTIEAELRRQEHFVANALVSGPKSEEQIAEVTGLPKTRAHRAIVSLLEQGQLRLESKAEPDELTLQLQATPEFAAKLDRFREQERCSPANQAQQVPIAEGVAWILRSLGFEDARVMIEENRGNPEVRWKIYYSNFTDLALPQAPKTDSTLIERAA